MPTLAFMSEAAPFEIATVPHDAGRRIVRVRGELDLATCPQLETALSDVPPGEHVVLDLIECSFLDSAAIRVVLAGAERATSSGSRLSLVATNPGVLRVLEIVNAQARMSIHPTVEAATAEQSSP